ncbi:MAG: BPL-N domain-containing protein [Longimicrobiales bacterium]
MRRRRGVGATLGVVLTAWACSGEPAGLSPSSAEMAPAPSGPAAAVVAAESEYARHWAVYTGSGTWEPSILAFTNFLTWKGHTWEAVGKNQINRGKLVGRYDGLFMPGGWAGNYNQSLTASGDQHIRDFISSGGAYIGMSAGAFYLCDVTIWEGDYLDYPSDVFDGDCIGPIEEIAPWPEYVMTPMDMNLEFEANVFEPARRDVLYYGEPYFVPHEGQVIETFASWVVPTNPAADGAPGVIGIDYGAGRAVLVGPHPEIEEDDDRDGTDFGSELSDGPDGSDWPMLWTMVDWVFQQPVTRAPGTGPAACSDGVDNDSDGLIDLADPGCADAADTDEADPVPPACSDGVDNDSDGWVDLADPGCSDPADEDETDPPPPGSIFADGFESGSLAEWSVYGSGRRWSVVSENAAEGLYSARAKRTGSGKDSFIEASFDAVGFSSVQLTYRRMLVGLDAADDWEVQVFDGSWISLEHLGTGREDNSDFQTRTFTLSPSATAVRFKCETGAVSEMCYLDDVRISGS